MLEIPAELAAAAGVPDLPSFLEDRDEAILRRTIALDNVPDAVIRQALGRAVESCRTALDTLRQLPDIRALFDQLSFVPGDAPDKYRRAVAAQKRRRHLTIVAGTER